MPYSKPKPMTIKQALQARMGEPDFSEFMKTAPTLEEMKLKLQSIKDSSVKKHYDPNDHKLKTGELIWRTK